MAFGARPEPRADAAAHATVDARAAFIVRTYAHLVGAVFAFVGVETVLFAAGIDDVMWRAVYNSGVNPNMVWLVVLAIFIGSGYLAQVLARSENPGLAYAGLGIEVVAWSVVFLLPMHRAVYYSTPDVLPSAAITTVLVFSGLTAVVFLTRKDFSFMKGILGVATMAAFAIIVCSLLFGFHLGIVFCGAMVMLAGGYVLYYTSNVLHHYRTDQHVAAALQLFSALALLFWYILQIFMRRR